VTSTSRLREVKDEVSVILAIRNEETFIGKCLESLLKQDFPQGKYEIIIVDGMSQDKTREVLTFYQEKFPGVIRVLDNPEKTQAPGRNIGIRNAKYKIVLIFSGHAYAHNQFLSILVNKLHSAPPEVAGVGSIHLPPEDERFFGKVIADVQTSILGGAGSSYRQKHRTNYVDSVAFCVYKKEVLESIGLLDENLDIGEDFELNWRIKKAGFKLMVCYDAITYYYRKHSSFKMLSTRMIKYGFWRAVVAKKHPDSFGILFSIPLILIVGIISLPVVIFVYPLLANIIFLGLTLYLLAIFLGSLHLSIKRRSIKYLVSVPIYMIEHFGIGLGFIAGLLRKLPND
jgi:glycosyltransferase involved in cell wall biosynthesis